MSTEKPDAAGPNQTPVQDVVVVIDDLLPLRPLLEASLWPLGLHRARAEHGRGHAVKQRRLMELHERIGVEPVAARRFTTIDQRDMYVVGVIDQRVDERHAHRSGADNEVVGLRSLWRHATHVT